MSDFRSCPSHRNSLGIAINAASPQRGSTLIITLIMLVLTTLMAVGVIRSATVDERLAGNFRDRDRAFQAAEAAMAKCLQDVAAGTFAGTILAPATVTDPPNWEAPSRWAPGSADTVEVSVDSTLAAQPRCLLESFGSANFRLTTRGVGGSADTKVMLQASF